MADNDIVYIGLVVNVESGHQTFDSRDSIRNVGMCFKLKQYQYLYTN